MTCNVLNPTHSLTHDSVLPVYLLAKEDYAIKSVPVSCGLENSFLWNSVGCTATWETAASCNL